MRPPSVVMSDVIELFDTVQGAEQYLEPPDVRHGEIRRILDRDGRPLRAIIRKIRPFPFYVTAEVVKLEEGIEPGDLGELRLALLQFLKPLTPDTLDDLPLEELIAKALPFTTT